ncbi:MAG: hypothetical protein GY870_10105 [archaeon]|nr:hypothetical protein [archaeon]
MESGGYYGIINNYFNFCSIYIFISGSGRRPGNEPKPKMEKEMITLTGILSTVITTAVTGLVTVGINYIVKKTKIDISAGTRALLQQSAVDAIHLVEEHVTGVKKNLGSNQYQGPEKLQLAVQEVMRNNKGLLQDEAEKLIKSTLSSLTNLGATGIVDKFSKISYHQNILSSHP